MRPAFAILLALSLTPVVALAQSAPAPEGAQTVSNGSAISSCSRIGADSTSAAAFSANGIYVPVNDAAVMQNTAYLVYKECVLRVLVDALRKAGTAGEVAQVADLLQHGRTDIDGNTGQPLFSTNFTKEKVQIDEKVCEAALNNGTFDTVNPAFRDNVKRAVIRACVARIKYSNTSYGCGYTKDANNLYDNKEESTNALDNLGYLANPACTEIWSGELADERLLGQEGARTSDYYMHLLMYNGFFGQEKVDSNGDVTILTPGSLNRAIGEQAVTSGFRQYENANDIGQIVGAYFADFGAKVLSDTGGLANISKPGGYISQMTAESHSDLVGSVVNAASTLIAGIRTTEANYNAALQSMADSLNGTVQKLRSAENTCWTQIISNVCTSSASSTASAVAASCTDSGGNKLTIATSTAFSQAAIAGNIAPLLNGVNQNLGVSNKILAYLDGLIANLANSSNPSAQQAAVQALDQLTGTGALHNQNNVAQAQQNAQTVQQQMSTLLTTTLQNWAGTDSNGQTTLQWDTTTNPAIGWCNYASPATLQLWDGVWKH